MESVKEKVAWRGSRRPGPVPGGMGERVSRRRERAGAGAGGAGRSRYRGRTKYATDHELIEGCREGRGGAWEAVLEKYERLVFSIPLNYGLSRDDAADVAQITFTILIQSLDTLNADSRLGAWLSTVARRHTWRAMERARREGPGKGEDLAESATLAGEGGGIETMERWELLEWLNGGLNLLDERSREFLIALYFDPEEPSYAEMAERFGMPLGSVGPTRARCLKRLKRALAGD